MLPLSKKNRARLLVALGVLGVAGAIGAFSVFELHEASAPPRPKVAVPKAFAAVRGAPGHAVHLAAEDVECGDCHDVDEGKFEGVAISVCTDCHDETPATIHTDVKMAKDGESPDCLGCHTFKGDPPLEAKDCMRCHAEATGGVHAIEQHAKEDCTACHRPHEEPSLRPADCTGCHAERASGHGAIEMDPAKRCLTCHDAHEDAELALATCTSCHAEHEPKVAAKRALFAGHDACTTCHEPHDFDAKDARRCADCHTDVVTLAAGHVEAHADCGSCHEPHTVRASAERSCEGCHRKVSADHPATDGKCTTCHVPHPSKVPGMKALLASSRNVCAFVKSSMTASFRVLGDRQVGHWRSGDVELGGPLPSDRHDSEARGIRLSHAPDTPTTRSPACW